jgi:hypothetical protein
VDAEARAEEAAWARLQTTLKATTGDDGDVSQDNIELLLTQVGGRQDKEKHTSFSLPYVPVCEKVVQNAWLFGRAVLYRSASTRTRARR